MSVFDNPILIYSKYCDHSSNFLQSLMKNKEIYDEFNLLDIDVDPATKKRPQMFFKIQQQLNKKITRVPCIIVKTSDSILTLSDKDAFQWLDFQINSNKKEIEGFNNNEMTSLSDNYSKFGSTDINDANEQSYTFYKNKKLPSDNFQHSGDLNNHDPSSFLDKTTEAMSNSQYNMSDLEKERSQIFQTSSNSSNQLNSKPNSQSIDFTSSNFGSSNQENNSQNNFDDSFAKLMNERSQM